MQIPFTVEQFFGVFHAYNLAVWPAQVLLVALAIAAVILVVAPRRWSGVCVSAILALLWTWIALAYHLAFFSSINPLANAFAGFSLLGAGLFVWHGVIRRQLEFRLSAGARTPVGLALVVFALVVYPAWSSYAGHRYPALPTFGLPCPTTIFTIGMLAFLVAPYPRSPLVIPVMWCFVGAQAAFIFDVPQDLGLVVAGLVGIVLLARSKVTVANRSAVKGSARVAVLGVIAFTLMLAALLIGWRFRSDMTIAETRAAQGSVLAATRCGAIEYQEAGTGIPLLVVHGSGGGHDQGMAFEGALARQGIRVIAMSRFGYLRTPMPADASPAAQADAHVCLLDALGIRQAAVLGGSAGAPSAMQMAIRHPDRVSALVLLVPLAYKPGALADSAPPLAPWVENMLMRLIGSDFLFWGGLHVARDALIKLVLATPPDQVAAASPPERARVNAMLDNILPVSARAQGLRSDSALGKSLGPYALDSIRAPTLVISTRDDGYGTYANAQYTAGRIGGAKFIGFDQGGHTWVGHDEEVRAEIVKLLIAQAKP